LQGVITLADGRRKRLPPFPKGTSRAMLRSAPRTGRSTATRLPPPMAALSHGLACSRARSMSVCLARERRALHAAIVGVMPTLQQTPPIYGKIFLMGSSKRDEATLSGRWRRPHLGLSYLLAARHVIAAGQASSGLSDVALPAAYLQRHALEVELKWWLSVLCEISRSSQWLDLLRNDPNADPPPEAPVPLTHSHLELCARLEAAVKVARWPDPMPPAVRDVAEQVAREEADAPERYRYDRVKVSGSKVLEDAFKKRTRLPIVETQHALEDVFRDVFHFDNDKADDQQTWGTQLIVEVDGLGQCIAQKYPSTWGEPLRPESSL
jgi:hypothetical protein